MATIDPVTIHEFGPAFDARGAKIVDGFPSVGLVSTIAANFLIDTLKLHQIATMDHPAFPTLSVVHNAEPLSPVRVYGGERVGKSGSEKLIVFVSEFQPNPILMRPIAQAMMEWAQAKKADFIVSPEGLVVEGEAAEDDRVDVYGIGSTARANQLLRDKGVESFREGIITGISGLLLQMGKRSKTDVISILAEAKPNYPDARSAASVIQIMGRLVGIEVDVAPLLREAEGFEAQIKTLQRKAAQRERRTDAQAAHMYG